MWHLPKSKRKGSSRSQIRIKEVKDGILVLPGNNYRTILESSSVNFELKSEDEQDVLIDSYQAFLHSLPSDIQILIRVREIDIDRYIERIAQSKALEKDEVYQEQIAHYSTFVKSLVSGNKILSRRFYIVIPFHSEERFPDFSFVKEQLTLRRDIIAKGLEKLGMKAKALDSIEILDLFYSFYNPAQAKTQELKGTTINMLLSHAYA